MYNHSANANPSRIARHKQDDQRPRKHHTTIEQRACYALQEAAPASARCVGFATKTIEPGQHSR